MVRRHLRTPPHRHRRFTARRARHPPRPQPARCDPHHRQPVTHDLPARRISHPQDAPLLPLRKQPACPRKSPHRATNRTWLQRPARSRQDRITNHPQTKLIQPRRCICSCFFGCHSRRESASSLYLLLCLFAILPKQKTCDTENLQRRKIDSPFILTMR